MKQIFSDISMILMAYSVFIFAYTSYTVFCIYQNIKLFHEHFELKRLMNGLVKCLVFVLGTLFLVVSIDSAAVVFQQAGLADASVGKMLSAAMLVSTIGVASLKYIKEAYAVFNAILTRE